MRRASVVLPAAPHNALTLIWNVLRRGAWRASRAATAIAAHEAWVAVWATPGLGRSVS